MASAKTVWPRWTMRLNCTTGIGIWQWIEREKFRARCCDGLLRRCAHLGDLGRRGTVRISFRIEGPRGECRRSDAAATSAEHPQAGLSDREFDVLFTKDKPIIFAFHAIPGL